MDLFGNLIFGFGVALSLQNQGITITRELSPVPKVWLDKHKVLQILINIIGNAKKAVKTLPEGQRHVRVRLEAVGRMGRVQVVDNGVGIAPEHRKRLFSQGFTTREGGASTGPYASFNLSTRVGDPRASVEKNQERLLGLLGRQGARLVTLRQVHGAEIVQVSNAAGRSIEADGVLTTDPLALLSVLVADCVPLLMADTKGTVVAAVHAGWRGTRERIASRMVKRPMR